MQTDKYKIAALSVKRKKEFYHHLACYIVVVGALCAINLIYTPTYFWCLVPLFGWAIGLLYHYTTLFGLPFLGIFDEKWEQKELEKELKNITTSSKEEGPNLNLPPTIEDEIEYNDFKNLRNEWKDGDFS